MKSELIMGIIGRALYMALGAVLMVLFTATNANAGLVGNAIDSAATSSWPVKETKKYKLNMYGFDARAYEFVTDNGMKCVAVFPGGSATGWQLQCTPASGLTK
jgi:hypothetical protein